MSSAARDPRPAADLPPLQASAAVVSEAPPDPPPGPQRDALAAEATAGVERAVGAMEAVLTAYNDRMTGLVAARMRSPKTRRGTRWWTPEPAGGVAVKTRVELKALDPGYVLPQRVAEDELREALRPVGLRIVTDSAAGVARRLGHSPGVGLSAFSWDAVSETVDDAVGRMLEVNARHARDVRREILDADATAETLDAAVDRVTEATRRGGRWLLLAGRTLATALAGDAALAAAKVLGVTRTAWVTRRDDRVRQSHIDADGQIRPVGAAFNVGGFRLRFPADPSGLPASAPVVYGCRCGLTWVPPSPERSRAVALAGENTPSSARAILSAAARGSGTAQQMTEGSPELGAQASVPEIEVPAEVVAHRMLDAVPPAVAGQRITWPGPLALGLAPAVAAEAALAVALPVGTAVGVQAGGVVLPSGTALEVLSAEAGRVVARPVSV